MVETNNTIRFSLKPILSLTNNQLFLTYSLLQLYLIIFSKIKLQFGLIFEPLLNSFNSTVSVANLDELYRTAKLWVDQNCSLVELRPGKMI